MIRFHVEKTAPGQPMPIHALDEQHLPRTVALLNVPKNFPFSADHLADNLASILNNHVPLRLTEGGQHKINYVRFAGGLELRASTDADPMTRPGGALISLTDHAREHIADQTNQAATLFLERLNPENMQLLCDATTGHRERIMQLSAAQTGASPRGLAP